MVTKYNKNEHDTYDAAAFDTETTGLNIIHDKPFLHQFGFINRKTMQGYAFLLDLEQHPELIKEYFKTCHELAKKHYVYLGHNVKFDLNMIMNIGQPYTAKNISDSQFYIRFGHDTLAPKNGGPPLKLKSYAAQYILRSAKSHEKLLEDERTLQATAFNKKLLARFQQAEPGQWTNKRLNDIFSDILFDYTDLSETLKEAFNTWLQLDLPDYLKIVRTRLIDSDEIKYNHLNRENLKKYAFYDIVFTLETFQSLYEVVQTRQTQNGIDFENSLIYPFMEMERVGFLVDKEYLMQSEQKMKAYIKLKRQDLYRITGVSFKIGQHKVIKEILSVFLEQDITSSDKKALAHLKQTLTNEQAIELIDLIGELRTLEKWYSTYIKRFIKNLNDSDRLYTSIAQVGAVSGRVSSDFQQFPKEGIKTSEGENLFSPRNLVKVPGNDYDQLVYLDYSQIELRFQAFYTILVGHPDLNLCRAYMPYKCHIGPMQFDYNNKEHLAHTQDWAWYYDEEPTKKWTPTDLHGAITEKAFDITPEDPDFQRFRSKYGKPLNFSKNYGAQLGAVWAINPKWTREEAEKINAAYYETYPGVKFYHTYCYNLASYQAYATNLFGIRYYGVSGHNLINMLIQGSAAYFLKWKILQIYEFSHSINLKSRFQMNIHDELSWEKHKDETPIFTKIKQIMEDWPDALVPIIAELEVSETTWANKHK